MRRAALLAFALALVAVALIQGQGSRARADRLPLQAEQYRAARAGLATYYAEDYHGRQMADGGMFNMWDATIAASNSYPLGTRLIVRRIPGGPWDATLTDSEWARFTAMGIIVTVRDRGAFTHDLDLSLAAFTALGRRDEGVLRVSIEVVGE